MALFPRRPGEPVASARPAGSTGEAPATSEPVEEVPAAPPGLGFEKWMGFLSSFVAPATLITGLLFYFGYVSSRAFFAYFGIDVDVLGLSNQAFVMRSPGALFVPVMLILIVAAGLVVGHRLLRRRVTRADVAARRRVVTALAWTGIALLLAGIVLAFLWGVLGDWDVYPLITPLALAAGAGLAAYAASTARALRGGGEGRSVIVLLVVVMVAGVFWTTATVAESWGRGQARTLAADLGSLPAVVLDTKEQLFPGNEAIERRELPAGDGQFRWRYLGLRLLVHGDSRLFLVPDEWSPNASTLVVPDGDVRVRFRFFPDANPPG